jgi:hypothetical protein
MVRVTEVGRAGARLSVGGSSAEVTCAARSAPAPLVVVRRGRRERAWRGPPTPRVQSQWSLHRPGIRPVYPGAVDVRSPAKVTVTRLARITTHGRLQRCSGVRDQRRSQVRVTATARQRQAGERTDHGHAWAVQPSITLYQPRPVVSATAQEIDRPSLAREPARRSYPSEPSCQRDRGRLFEQGPAAHAAASRVCTRLASRGCRCTAKALGMP